MLASKLQSADWGFICHPHLPMLCSGPWGAAVWPQHWKGLSFLLPKSVLELSELKYGPQTFPSQQELFLKSFLIFVSWSRHSSCSQTYIDKPTITTLTSFNLGYLSGFWDQNLPLLCLTLDALKCSFLSSMGSMSHRGRLSKEFSRSIYRPIWQSNRENTNVFLA